MTCRRPALIGALVLLLAACTSTSVPSSVPPSASASPSVPASPSGSPSGSPSAVPSSSPSASPSASPSTSAGPSSAPTPCVIAGEGQLPSDKFTDIKLVRGPASDRIVFQFAPGAIGSLGIMELAEPPYTAGASGLPLEVPGQRVVRVRFEGMTFVDEDFNEVFKGPLEIAGSPGGPVRAVVNEEIFEGYIGWLIGWDGAGCPTLRTDLPTNTVVLDIPRG